MPVVSISLLLHHPSPPPPRKEGLWDTLVDEIEKRGATVHFRFDRFSSEEVFNCGYFDITTYTSGVDERSRTHWAVKKGNIVEGLFKLLRDRSKYERPRLFNVEQWPLPVLLTWSVRLLAVMALVGLTLALAACEDPDPEPTPTAAATATPTPVQPTHPHRRQQ